MNILRQIQAYQRTNLVTSGQIGLNSDETNQWITVHPTPISSQSFPPTYLLPKKFGYRNDSKRIYYKTGKAIMVISNALDSICRGRECYLTELKDCAIVKGKTQFCSIANAREILDRIQLGKLEHNSLRVRLPAKEPKSIGTHLKMEFHSIILTSLQVEPIAPFFPKWLTNDFLVLIIIFALSSTYTGDIMQRIFL